MPILGGSSLSTKLIGLFMVVAMLPVAVAGVISFNTAKGSLNNSEFAALANTRDLRKQELLNYFASTFDLLTFLATYDRAFMACEWLDPAGDQSTRINRNAAEPSFWKIASTAPPALEVREVLKELQALYTSFLVYNGQRGAYHDIIVISSKDGIVRYTARKLSDIGADLKTGPLKESGLGQLWKRVVETGKPMLVDMTFYKPAGAPALFAGVPLMGPDGMLHGVVAARIGPERINSFVAAGRKIGGAGKSFLVGPDYLMRSDTASGQDSEVLKRKADWHAVRDALGGKTGILETADFDGVPVLCTFAPVGLDREGAFLADFDWALIAEKSRHEVRLPIWMLAKRIAIVALLVAFAVMVVAIFLARSIAHPVAGLTERMRTVSSGDLSVHVPQLNRRDEVGQLNDSFKLLVESLRDQTGQIQEGVNVLRSAGAEISSTVSQVVSGATKTSTVVTGTVATVEQLKQAARVADERAQGVAESAEEAVKVSTEGKKATDDTVAGMNFIKEQMESVAETVMRLSEQSQAIEQIIGTVQDLADQSNLLAVNASIEAARAGDRGKGFAVVAQEIKSLADQSREATQQVRNILEDTQKWVGAVVMATEQGGKAVESGLSQAMATGESIQDLTARVVDSARAASVIVASIQQQFAGIDEVAGTMAHIDSRVRQNLTGMSKLESSAKSLDNLGEALKEIAERYRV